MNTSEKLKVFEYVTAEKAPMYRAVMRVFMDSKEGFALQLRPTDVLAGIAATPAVEPVDLSAVEVLLNQLCDWGNLESHPDTADVTTVDDFLKRRYLFQLSVRGEAAERAIAAYEESILQPGELQTAALADIRNLLEEVAQFAESAEIDDAKITLALRTLCSSFEELTRRAQIFMSGLQRRIDLQRIEFEEFILYKERLIDYLQRFVGELVIAADEIASALRRIERAGVDRLLPSAARRETADLVGLLGSSFFASTSKRSELPLLGPRKVNQRLPLIGPVLRWSPTAPVLSRNSIDTHFAFGILLVPVHCQCFARTR